MDRHARTQVYDTNWCDTPDVLGNSSGLREWFDHEHVRRTSPPPPPARVHDLSVRSILSHLAPFFFCCVAAAAAATSQVPWNIAFPNATFNQLLFLGEDLTAATTTYASVFFAEDLAG